MQELHKVVPHPAKIDDFEDDFLLQMHYEKFHIEFLKPNYNIINIKYNLNFKYIILILIIFKYIILTYMFKTIFQTDD